MRFKEFLVDDFKKTDWRLAVRLGILMFLLFWLCCFIISGCAKPKPVTSVPTAPTNLHVHMVIKSTLVFDPQKPTFQLKSADEFWAETGNDFDCYDELKKWAASPYVLVCS